MSLSNDQRAHDLAIASVAIEHDKLKQYSYSKAIINGNSFELNPPTTDIYDTYKTLYDYYLEQIELEF